MTRGATVIVVASAIALACDGHAQPSMSAAAAAEPEPAPQEQKPDDGDRAQERAAMVKKQLARRNIKDKSVLAAMRAVPRHRFVPPEVEPFAYEDRPLPIGHDVTISQPYIVALMTQLAKVEAKDRVLDVGTGSGYQAAVLAELGAEVYGIEIIEPLAKLADERLEALGYNVEVRHGDGYRGWPDKAPFKAIILAAAPKKIPPALKAQLQVGGRLVLPVGPQFRQELRVITRTRSGYKEETVIPVAFVPMTGEAQKAEPSPSQ